MEVDLPYANISFNSSFVVFKIKDDAMLDAEAAKNVLRVADEMAGNKPHGVLTDARVYFNINSEARQVFANKLYSSLVKANAVIVNNLATKLTADFFSNFNKPHFSYKVFTSEQKAKAWLLEKINAKAKLKL